jgi:hypothetical protein
MRLSADSSTGMVQKFVASLSRAPASMCRPARGRRVAQLARRHASDNSRNRVSRDSPFGGCGAHGIGVDRAIVRPSRIPEKGARVSARIPVRWRFDVAANRSAPGSIRRVYRARRHRPPNSAGVRHRRRQRPLQYPADGAAFGSLERLESARRLGQPDFRCAELGWAPGSLRRRLRQRSLQYLADRAAFRTVERLELADVARFRA